MIGSNGKELTPPEYRGYFADILESKCKQTFNTDVNQLVFLTFQPSEPVSCKYEMQGYTYRLLKTVRYLEVVEKTFKVSKQFNTGKYLDSYHSHIIMRQSDYQLIKDNLKGLNVVVKGVYDLVGLKHYLIKQVGVTDEKHYLPTNYLPLIEIEPIQMGTDLGTDTITHTNIPRVKQMLAFISLANPYILLQLFGYTEILTIASEPKRTNKHHKSNMYINDT